MSVTQTHAPDQLDAEVGRDLRHVALVISTSLWRWTQPVGLGVTDGNVLLALSETGGGVRAAAVSARSGLPLDVVYAALHRLTRRGYVHEEHRQHKLTDAGRGLVADFDRAERTGAERFSANRSIPSTKGMS
jgi:hypothetical protein